LSSPAVDLSKLGLAPPAVRSKDPLPTAPLADIVSRSYATLISHDRKVQLNKDYVSSKKRYEEELALAEQYGYVNGKNRIPKRLRLKQ
jgi:hypothetical protein